MAIQSRSIVIFRAERVEAASGPASLAGYLVGPVEETLKGSKADHFRLALGPKFDVAKAKALAEHHSTLMVFSRYGIDPGVDATGGTTLTADGATWVILSDPEAWWDQDIKDHVALNTHFRTVMGEAAVNLVRQTLAHRGLRVVNVSAVAVALSEDAELLPLAVEWATSDDWEVRKLAATAISMRPATPESVKTLSKLLQDRYLEEIVWAGLSPWSERDYPVRMEAAEAVSTLGLKGKFPKTKLSEDPGLYKRVPLWWLAAPVVAGAIVFLTRYFARKWLRMPAPSILNRVVIVPVVLSVLVCVFNAGMWARSYITADDYVLAHDGIFYNATSFRGGWRLEIAFGFPPEKPLVHYAMLPDRVDSDMILPEFRFFRNRFGSAIGYEPDDTTAAFMVDTHWKDSDELPELTVPGAWPGEVPPLDAKLVVLPHRYVMMATAPLPVAYLLIVSLIWWRRRRRARSRHCRKCGYDLRVQLAGTGSAVCPECGEAWYRRQDPTKIADI